MGGTSEFTTERLLMRKYRIEDAVALHKKFGRDPRMYEYSGWNPYASLDIAKETIQRFMESYGRADFYGSDIMDKKGSLELEFYPDNEENNYTNVVMGVAEGNIKKRKIC